MTTVGYGDISAETNSEMLFSVLAMATGTSYTHVLTYIHTYIRAYWLVFVGKTKILEHTLLVFVPILRVEMYTSSCTLHLCDVST